MDLRQKILRKLFESNLSTEEFIANEFLQGVHSDTGTIKRALVDLLELGYIKESNINWSNGGERINKSIINKIDSNKENSSSKVALKSCGRIRLYITLDGKKYIENEINNKENERIMRELSETTIAANNASISLSQDVIINRKTNRLLTKINIALGVVNIILLTIQVVLLILNQE